MKADSALARALDRAPGRRALVAGALAAIAVVAVALGFVVGGGVVHRAARGTRAASPRHPAAPPGWVRFRDPAGKLSLAYPASWRRLSPGDPDVRLVATGGRSASVLVRSVDLGYRVGRANLPAVKRLTDRLVTARRGVRLLSAPKPVELDGLPGWFYFYEFRAGRRAAGAHSHYFLFDGATMITLVFQSVPAGRFPALSGTFDRIAGTFRAR